MIGNIIEKILIVFVFVLLVSVVWLAHETHKTHKAQEAFIQKHCEQTSLYSKSHILYKPVYKCKKKMNK